MQRTDLLETTIMLKKTKGWRKRKKQKMKWLNSTTDLKSMSKNNLHEWVIRKAERLQSTGLPHNRIRLAESIYETKASHSNRTHKKLLYITTPGKEDQSQNFSFVKSVFVYNHIGFVQLTEPPKIMTAQLTPLWSRKCMLSATQKTHLRNEHS